MSSLRPDDAIPEGTSSGGSPNGSKPPSPPQPSLHPTSPATLVVAALVTAGLSWLGISPFFAGLPRLLCAPAPRHRRALLARHQPLLRGHSAPELPAGHHDGVPCDRGGLHR